MRPHPQNFYFILIFCSISMFFSSAVFTQIVQTEMAGQDHAKISEQYLQSLANMEWEASFKFLAEDVEFKLPDGDTDSRTVFKGKKAVMAFWNNYEANSGNDRTTFSQFVHIPVQINEMTDQIGMTGAFNLCYFSAELGYGKQTANVRMHWAFHFNSENKIDGIYSYYDRTPIIEAADRNFLAEKKEKFTSGQGNIVQIVKIKSALSDDEIIQRAKVRAQDFAALPGLVQKYYIQHSEPGYFGGVYIWDSKEALMTFKVSELAASIGKAYEVQGGPQVEISEVLFQLRD